MSPLGIAASVVIAAVALLHAWFLVLEMFLWTKPTGRRVFNLTPEFAEESKTLAANQGLYNGFLAAGLAWGLIASAVGWLGAYGIKVFFLTYVIVAGVFGAATVNQHILFVQTLPAVIGLGLLVAAQP